MVSNFFLYKMEIAFRYLKKLQVIFACLKDMKLLTFLVAPSIIHENVKNVLFHYQIFLKKCDIGILQFHYHFQIQFLPV
jgi:hypothetical protein